MLLREHLIREPIAAKLIGRTVDRLRLDGWIPTLTKDGEVLYSFELLKEIFGFKCSRVDVERALLDAVQTLTFEG